MTSISAPASKSTADRPQSAVAYTATRAITVSDQFIVALANFALTLAIGRSFPAEEFASYGIGLSIGLMVQGLQRHALTIPLTLQERSRVVQRRGALMGEQLIVLAGALLIAVALLVLALALGATRYMLLTIGASATCLLIFLQLEFTRAFLFKLGKPWLLLASAVTYAIITALLAASALTGRIEYESLLLVLCASMLVHALALAAITGRLEPALGLSLLRADLRRYGGWAAAATATYSGYNHAPLLLLGAVAAPLYTAAFVATRSLMQPLQILLRGLDIVDKSAFSDTKYHPHGSEALRFTKKIALLYALVAVCFGMVVFLFAEPLITLAYGDKFEGFGHTLIAWIPVYLLIGVALPIESLLYRRHDFRGYFIARGIASLVAVAVTLPLIAWSPSTGAVLACGIGWLIAIGATSVLLARGTKS